VFSIAWPVLAVPVLAYHGVIPGGRMPPEAFALGITLFVMLPAALWVTAVTNGRDGVKALLHRALRWRFGWRWWAFVLFAMPVTALLVGLGLGGSLRSTRVLSVLGSSFASIGVAVIVINLWEETVWAGFLQTRLEQRHNLVTAAALTAVPFAGVHMPLLLLAHHITTASLLVGIGGLLVLAVLIRLMIGLLLRAAADSLLSAGVLHQLFDASNNKGGLVDRLLNGADEGVAALAAAGVLTAVIAVCVRNRLRAKPSGGGVAPPSPSGSAQDATLLRQAADAQHQPVGDHADAGADREQQCAAG
jgi:membrane protease YdiL (CAAX protease family)